MKILLWLVGGLVASFCVVISLVWRMIIRAKRHERKLIAVEDRANARISTMSKHGRRSDATAIVHVQDLGKRGFLRQFTLGSVASLAAWLATRGTDARWAEKLIVAADDPIDRPGARQKPAFARPPHQDDPTPPHLDDVDPTAHNDSHNDSHSDTPATDWMHADNGYSDHADYDVIVDYGIEPSFHGDSTAHVDFGEEQPFQDLHTDENPNPHTDEPGHSDS